nr:expressed conserved protein [Hymenolepis microstoma]
MKNGPPFTNEVKATVGGRHETTDRSRKMKLTSFILSHFIPYKRVPGSLWAGKQRKIPRLTASRKMAFMDEMLVTQQNERYLSKPYITPEAEAMTLPEDQAKALDIENGVFYKIDEKKFRHRFPDRKLDEFLLALNRDKKFSV